MHLRPYLPIPYITKFLFLFALPLLFNCQSRKKSNVEQDEAKRENIDANLPPSMQTLADFQENGKERSAKTNDSLFVVFLGSFTAYQNNTNSILYKDPKYDLYSTAAFMSEENLDPKAVQFRDSVKQLGFFVSMAKGMMFLDKDPDFLTQFSPYLSERMNSFLEEYNKNIITPFIEDNNIIISTSEQIRRMMFWENFAKENPDFELPGYAKNKFELHLYYLMMGTNVSPIHEQQSMKIRSELIEGYKYVIQDFPNSIAAAYLKNYLEFIEQHNYTFDKSFNEYARAKFPQFFRG